ncbi:MAG: hypothetical protein AMXMBFR34_11580 [Myxococcaceae bacterium]
MPWPVSADAIRAAEARLGVRFPTDFVAGMRALNGGEVRAVADVWVVCPFLDTSDRKRLSRTSNDIVRETLSFRQLEWFPPGAVVVAVLNQDCLVLVPADDDPSRLRDEVFVWHLDAEGVTATGSATLVSSTSVERIEPVFNFEVEGDHDYFVGELAVAVHNTSKLQKLVKIEDLKPIDGAARPVEPQRLRAPPVLADEDEGVARHHLVAQLGHQRRQGVEGLPHVSGCTVREDAHPPAQPEHDRPFSPQVRAGSWC